MATIQKLHSPFQLSTGFQPMGDQPRAIEELTEGLYRGDPYQTLLGATGTGKSVAYDEPVFVVERLPDGRRRSRVTPIGPLVDAALAERTDRAAGGTEERDLDGDVLTYAYDPRTGQAGLVPVGALIRHESPETLYRVRTACGRAVTLTGDHNLWVLRDGRPALIETADARPTDAVPVPDAVPFTGRLDALDLAAVLQGEALFVYAQGALTDYAEAGGTTAFAGAFARHHGGNPYTKLFDARRGDPGRGGIDLATFCSVSAETDGLGGHLDLADAEVGAQRGARLPARLALTDDLLYLFGVYMAEGAVTARYVLLSNRDPAVLARVRAALDGLGLAAAVRPSGDLQVNASVLARLFERTCGTGSARKRLPSFWPALDRRQLGALLRGYFDGDGTVGRASAVSATTASPGLASDLGYALLRLGVWARTAAVRKRATSSDHTGGTYHKVTISGQDDLERFARDIGFEMEPKCRRLAQAMDRAGNTNVDVVPIRGADLRALRQQLGLSARALGDRADVTRSAVQSYETETRRPSRAVLARICAVLTDQATARNVTRQTAEAIDALRSLTAVRWSPVAAVEAIAPEHEYVYDLSVPGPETFLAGAGGLIVHNTFTMANVIRNVGKPTLVISHNKTLAAQLYAEFRQFFPDNAVEFFISYYDYYQPEAYIVSSDTYIEKDMAINEEIDRLRLRATSALVSGRQDVVIVASVSCIYGLGNPDEYKKRIVQVKAGEVRDRDELLLELVHVFYNRNDVDFTPGTFRVRGDVVEVFPAYFEDQAYRIVFWGDEVERIARINPVTGDELAMESDTLTIYPAKHFVTPQDQVDRAIAGIEEELRWRLAILRNEGNLVAAQRIEQRTLFDIEMIKEIGYCSGIENYSRHMDGREPGTRPYCLLDYFQKNHGDDWQMVIDESHVTVPQVRGMYNGDRARKLNLVEHGFRLPSAMDNRPLTFEEFETFHHNVTFVSATPADYELEQSGGIIVEQIIRPTGILDPQVEVRPVEGQIDDLLGEIRDRVKAGGRALVTTLTKRMSEDLTDYLDSFGVRVRYLHSDIDALERVDILRDLRLGEFDVLVGINLLREGLDLPEVNLVAILDADKEGFLRSERSLIQTAGRAARNADSVVVLYADRVTDSMARMMDETERRREIQAEYNAEHGITPTTVTKSIDEVRRGTAIADHKAEQDERKAKDAVTYYSGPEQLPKVADPVVKYLTDDQKRDMVAQLTREMDAAAEALEFEKAAEIRDSIAQIEADLAA